MLINKTKKKVVATKVIVRESLWEIIIGLLRYKIKNEYIYDYLKWKKFSKSNAMLFKVRGKFGIHTWFMSFPIAVFFLNKDMKVIEKVRLDPFESYKPKKKYECFFELEGSRIRDISIGDELELKSENKPLKKVNKI